MANFTFIRRTKTCFKQNYGMDMASHNDDDDDDDATMILAPTALTGPIGPHTMWLLLGLSMRPLLRVSEVDNSHQSQNGLVNASQRH